MIFDPIYLIMIAPALLLSLWASFRVKSNFNKYSRLRSMSGRSGAEVASAMMCQAGIDNVRIVRSQGMLSDHYNPVTRTLALSESVHDSDSVAAISVAAHEAGHALQHASNYAPLWIRSMLVPTAGIGSNIGWFVMTIGLFMSSANLIYLGAALFSLVLLFQIVTLPVEFDASSRAKKILFESGFIAEPERRGVSAVLNAAALTYVAAAISTLLTLLYFLLRARR